MITSLFVDNFKTLNACFLSLEKTNVLIGANGSGKSSILQVFAFLEQFAAGNQQQFFSDRSWDAHDIRSQLNASKYIVFRITFQCDCGNMGTGHPAINPSGPVTWEVKFTTSRQKAELSLVSETITLGSTVLASYDSDKQLMQRFRRPEMEQESLSINNNNSLLTLLPRDAKKNYPELSYLQEYMKGSHPYELLSLEKLRKPSRGDSTFIGYAGEKIATYLHHLSTTDKAELAERLSKKYGSHIGIKTEMKGQPGWINLKIQEHLNSETSILVNSQHVSDGTMRLLALASIYEVCKSSPLGFVLLDEIEDGIYPKLAAEVINEIKSETTRQLIATTHSTVFLDYFDINDIVYIWRTKAGNTSTKRFSESQKAKEMLKTMYPGELWLNVSDSDLRHILEV